MPREVDDELLVSFLNVYKKYPCLWNPYHTKYYDCTAKNAALQKIINELGIPGFTVADYLRQISTIREKYRGEQMRTINGLQSQVPYKSPHHWYDIVADMLKRVINDEEKVSYQTTSENKRRINERVLKSLNNDNTQLTSKNKKRLLDTKFKISTCFNEVRNNADGTKAKSVEKNYPYFPRLKIASKHRKNENKYNSPVERVRCPSQKTTENSLKFRGERALLSDPEPTRDVGPGIPEKAVIFPCALNEPQSSNLRKGNVKRYNEVLLCPSCGWEETEYEKPAINAEKDFNDRFSFASQKNTVVCPSYKSSIDKDIEVRVPRTTENRIDKDAEDFGSENLPNEVPCPSRKSDFNEIPVNSYCRRALAVKAIDQRKCTDEGVQCKQAESTVPNDVMRYKSTNQNTLDFSPDVENNFQNGILVASTQFKIVLPNSDDSGQANPLGRVKKTIFPSESFYPESKATQANLITANFSERETQSTICTLNQATSPPNFECCVSLQTSPQIKSNDAKSCEDTKNAHCIQQPKLMESFPPKLKEVGVNTLQQVDKKIQSTDSVSCGNLIRCSPSEETEETSTVCVRNERNAVAVDFEHSEKIQTDFTLLTRNGKYIPLVPVTSKNVAKCATKIVRQSDDPCTTDTCLRNNDIVKEDSNLVQILQEYLQRILLSKNDRETQTEESLLSRNSNLQTNSEYKCNVEGNCTIDMTNVISKIKECAHKLLKSDLDSSHPKDPFLRGFRSRCDENPMCAEKIDPKPKAKELKNSFTDMHEISALHEETDVNAKSEPLITEDKAQQIYVDKTARSEARIEEFSLEDKSVSTSFENRDVGTNGSLSMLSARGAETQYAPRSLNNSVSSAKHARSTRKKISVGTQKRDPIIVRVIKCTNERTILEPAIEMQSHEAAIDLQRCVNKNVGPCRRENCMVDAHQKRSISRKGAAKYLHSISEDVRKSSTEKGDLLKRWTASRYECDKSCKDRGLFKGDWTDVTKAL